MSIAPFRSTPHSAKKAWCERKKSALKRHGEGGCKGCAVSAESKPFRNSCSSLCYYFITFGHGCCVTCWCSSSTAPETTTRRAYRLYGGRKGLGASGEEVPGGVDYQFSKKMTEEEMVVATTRRKTAILTYAHTEHLHVSRSNIESEIARASGSSITAPLSV
ncbi:DNA-directed RNA polymerase subunit beta [Anopheles sinensis]|uniref:DNA-directed RNA polymerase subunit beta n=1 Tax=Anopheles sinensis TaxID=74873 RepID=A0A084W4M2_ANOSI|nr:DNA-directed RNA polymerase subunit beta [Anopheles sinensis]